MFQQLVQNFTNFWWNSSTLMQKNHVFKKYSLGKFWFYSTEQECGVPNLIFSENSMHFDWKNCHLIAKN